MIRLQTLSSSSHRSPVRKTLSPTTSVSAVVGGVTVHVFVAAPW